MIMKYLTMISLLGISLAGGTAGAADAKALYDKNCAKCHGPDGAGKTKMGRQSGVKDYTDPKVQAEMKDDAAMQAIRDGIVEKGKKKMDPYKDKLSDDEIKSLIALMRSFKK